MTQMQEAATTVDDTATLPDRQRTSLRSAASTAAQRGQELGARFHKVHFAHARPRTFAEELARHRKVAASHGAPILRYPRYAWTAVHLAIKSLCVLIEWATFSPAVTLLAAAVIVSFLFLTHLI